MAIALDNKGSSSVVTTSPSTTSYTVGTLTNGILVVTVNYKYLSAPTLTVTYAGSSMVLVRTDASTTATAAATSIYYIIAPNSGANNVVVSWTGTVTDLQVGFASFSGVNQSSPIDAQNGANSASSNTATTTLTLTTIAANTAVIGTGLVLATANPAGDDTYTKPAALTSIYTNVTSGFNSGTGYELSVSPGGNSLTWTQAAGVGLQATAGSASSACSLTPFVSSSYVSCLSSVGVG